MNRLTGSPLNFLLAAITGAALILIFPNASVTWLAPFALAPLLVALGREPRPWRRFLLGWFSGVIFWFGVCYWIQFVLAVHGGLGQWGGWGTFLLFCVLKAIHTGVFALLAAILIPQWYAVPAIAALWTGIERTHADFGFTWLLLGNAGIDMAVPLRLAPFIGVYGLSFIFAAMSVATALVFLRRPRPHIYWVAIVLPIFVLPSIPATAPATASATMVQPNIPAEAEFSPVQAEMLHQRLIGASLAAVRSTTSRLIIWPEIPGPFYYYNDPLFHDEADALAVRAHAYFLFGTVAFTPQRQPLNSAVMLRPDGAVVDRYDKIHLVPFGEFVPSFFGWVNRITQETSDFVPGTRRVVFAMDGHRVGAFICYESAFSNEVRKFVLAGADVLANISNDGYFGHSAARKQHLELVRMRAVENRRWILRDTNDGYTVVIDPSGRITDASPPYIETIGNFKYGYVEDMTPYTRDGDWFAWACLAAAIVALFASQLPHYTQHARRNAPQRQKQRR